MRPIHVIDPTNGGNNTVETPAISMTATDSKLDRPEWIRLPQPGQRCRFTGLSRSTLNELCIDSPVNGYKAPVKSIVLKKRGAMRGIRLISYDSLMAHLESLADKIDVPSSSEKGGIPNG